MNHFHAAESARSQSTYEFGRPMLTYEQPTKNWWRKAERTTKNTKTKSNKLLNSCAASAGFGGATPATAKSRGKWEQIKSIYARRTSPQAEWRKSKTLETRGTLYNLISFARLNEDKCQPIFSLPSIRLSPRLVAMLTCAPRAGPALR